MDPAPRDPAWSFAGRMVRSGCSVVTLNGCAPTPSRGLFHHCSSCTGVKTRRLGLRPAGAAGAFAYPRSAGAERLPAPGGPRPGDAPEHRQPQRRDDERSVPAAGQARRLAVAGQTACRYGTNDSLKLLRQSYRAHRLMDGLLRIAADPLHELLLAGGHGGRTWRTAAAAGDGAAQRRWGVVAREGAAAPQERHPTAA